MDAPGAARLTGGAAEALRQAGLRVTRPRLAVYEALVRLGGHRSADEIGERLRADGEGRPRASVYNAIQALTGVGLVLAADAGPGRALYEAAAAWHHHFVCRCCGQVSDVPCLVGAKPCLSAALLGAEIDEAQVIFRGVCPSCARKRTGRERGRRPDRTA